MPQSGDYYPTVMVADDDELVRFALRAALESDGYIVFEARTGQEAVTVAVANTIEAILLDAHMPGWTLFETLDALRASPATANAAVVVLSGSTVELAHHTSSVFAVTRKPIALQSLRTLLQSIAEIQSSDRRDDGARQSQDAQTELVEQRTTHERGHQ